jgi:polar amino acid transport system substrate-binding protein
MVYFVSNIFASEGNLKSILIVTGEYSPAIDENKDDKGYISRLVSDAFALEGIKAEFLFVNWPRAEYMVETGKEVCVMYYAKNQKRIKSFLFSEPIFEEKWLFYHLKKTEVNWNELEDLSSYIIGGTKSYSYSEEFYDLIAKKILQVNWVTRDEQNWKMLMAGRIDIFPNLERIGLHKLKEIYGEEATRSVVANPKPLATQLNYLLCSKKHPNGEYFRDKFNQGFAKLKKIRAFSSYNTRSNNNWPTENKKH